MSIAYAALVAILGFAFLWLLGFATLSVTEKNGRSTDSRILFLSPAVGLALISIISTFATLANLPSSLYAKVATITFAIFSLFVLAAKYKSNPIIPRRRNIWISPAIAFLLGAIIGLLPLVLGGWQYVILRGNGTDAFNYVALADAIKEYPIDWILNATKQQLAEISPSLSLAQDLIRTRWTTSAVLAFFSSAFDITSIGFEYAYTVMLFMVTSFTLVAALIMIGLRRALAVALSLAFCFGFWGQLILDLRAFSHIAALPIFVAIIAQLVASPGKVDGSFPCAMDWKINAVLLAGVIFQYPELMVPFFPGLLIFLWLRLNKGWYFKRPSREVVAYAARLTLGSALLLSPLLGFLLAFTKSQTNFAMQKSLGWDAAYFSWLKDPIRGIWGLSVAPGVQPSMDHAYLVIGFLTAGLLDVIVLGRVIHILKHRDKPWILVEAGIAAMLAIGTAGAGYLVYIDNPWAAGKLATYFSILLPIWFAVILSEKFLIHPAGLTSKQKLWRYLTFATFASWALGNFIFASARTAHAFNGTDYSGYIMHHGEYRRVNAGLFAGKLISSCPNGAVVAVIDPRVWAREFQMHLLEGLGYKVVLPGVKAIRAESLSDKIASKFALACVLAGVGHFDIAGQEENTPSIVPGPLLTGIVDIRSEYGLEFDGATKALSLWSSGRTVEIHLFSDMKRDVNIGFELCPGRKRTKENPIKVYFGESKKPVEIDECTTAWIPYSATMGLNVLPIAVEDDDKSATIIGVDPRDLKLLIKILGFRQEPI